MKSPSSSLFNHLLFPTTNPTQQQSSIFKCSILCTDFFILWQLRQLCKQTYIYIYICGNCYIANRHVRGLQHHWSLAALCHSEMQVTWLGPLLTQGWRPKMALRLGKRQLLSSWGLWAIPGRTWVLVSLLAIRCRATCGSQDSTPPAFN